ncbi:MAG: DNA polymerase subunit beta [Succinivibrio dextrinosolvens]|nr:DNA polymerase subunit beta [Succinivibrio dextrinosolvens]
MFRLFGSVAREEDTFDSDIDFLVHVDYDSRNYQPGITIKLKNDLIKLLNIDVDVVTDEALSPNFKEVIENEVKLLYA